MPTTVDENGMSWFIAKHKSTENCLICCVFSFENFYHLCSEVGTNSRRVVRQIPDELLNNSELQDAVRQVKNWSTCLTYNFLRPLTGFNHKRSTAKAFAVQKVPFRVLSQKIMTGNTGNVLKLSWLLGLLTLL